MSNQSDLDNGVDLDNRSQPDWEDPTVPVGNAPSMPMWPLIASILAWCGGIIFLLFMMSERIR